MTEEEFDRTKHMGRMADISGAKRMNTRGATKRARILALAPEKIEPPEFSALLKALLDHAADVRTTGPLLDHAVDVRTTGA